MLYIGEGDWAYRHKTHARDAEERMDCTRDCTINCRLTRLVTAIWKAGKTICTIRSDQLQKEMGVAMEASIIDLIGLEQLANVKRGNHRYTKNWSKQRILSFGNYGIETLYKNYLEDKNKMDF